MQNTILHDQIEIVVMKSMVVLSVGQEQKHLTIAYHSMFSSVTVSKNMSIGSTLAYVGYQIHNQLVSESYILLTGAFLWLPSSKT